MRHSLLLLGVIAALAIGAPAYSQYIYMDSNADGVNSSADVLSSSTTVVHVYLNTNHDRNGTLKTCIATGGGLSSTSRATTSFSTRPGQAR